MDLDELKLLENVKLGRPGSFETLSDMYEPLISSLVRRYSSISEAEADDLAQEALLALFDAARSFDTTREGITFGLYAKVCIRNRLVSCLRKLGRARSEAEIIPDGASPEESFLERESYAALIRGLGESLTPLERDVFILYIEGVSYREAAARLNINEKAVDNAVSRIKRKLKKLL